MASLRAVKSQSSFSFIQSTADPNRVKTSFNKYINHLYKLPGYEREMGFSSFRSWHQLDVAWELRWINRPKHTKLNNNKLNDK